MKRSLSFLPVLAIAAAATPALAQQAGSAPSAPLEVGAVAPDFVMPAATRHGILQNRVHLSDYKGKTVVLAFFFRARTRG